MRLVVIFLLFVALLCIDGRGGGRIRIRFGGRSSGRGVGSIFGGRASSRPRGKGGWFSSSGRRTSSSSGSWYSSSGTRKSSSSRSRYSSSGTSYSRLRRDITKEDRSTNFGTKFTHYRVPSSKKMFGLGVGAGFIGGSGYGYAATLMTYSIYHRYLFLMALLHSNGYKSDWDREYHAKYYERNKCVDGCHPHSHCEWGICECVSRLQKMWGRCTNKNDTEPKLGSQDPFQSCSKSEECWKTDINLICTGQEGQKYCKCRKDMAWNSKFLECQIFLDVDCQDLNEQMRPSKLVQQAANIGKREVALKTKIGQEEKCLTAKKKCVDEKCQEKANLKVVSYFPIFANKTNKEEVDNKENWTRDLEACTTDHCRARANLKWVTFQKKANCSRQSKQIVEDGVLNYPGKCGTNPYLFIKYFYNETRCTVLDDDKIRIKALGWLMKTDRCVDKWCVGTVNGNCKRYCEGHELNYYSPEDKTETKNQSLASSLLIHVEDKNPKEKDLVEAFCRDIDSFNLAFQKPDEVWRPSEYCKQVPETACAVVYDSHDCYDGWSLNITDGAHLSFGYFSSWSNRNDIDTVGVKAGCTFTGFSDTSFDGKIMSISAGLIEKWVVLAKTERYKDMHENIESIQCVCR